MSTDEKRPLAIGKLWHEVLERHYGQLMLNADPSAEDLMRGVAPLLYDEAGNQSEYQELVSWMYAGHVEHWGLDPQWEILAVEHAAEMWLPTDRGTRSGFKLKVKIDLVVQWKGKIWIIDHKSGANLPKQQELALSDQFGLYAWALRQLGKPVFGIIYNAARTNRLQRPMTLDERFSRELMYRTDTELETLAVEAWRSAKNLYGFRAGEAPRNPDPDRCGWKCQFLDACLASRRGSDIVHFLEAQGQRRDATRH